VLQGQRSWLWLQIRRRWPRRLDPELGPTELVEEVNLAAVAGFARFRGRDRASFRAWLKGILLNHWRQALRRLTGHGNGREVERLPSDGSSGGGPADPGTPVPEKVARGELVGGVVRALDYLEERDARLLRLHYFEGRTFEEAAALLGEEPAALRQRSRRLLARLRVAVPLLVWADQRGWPAVRCEAIGLWRVRSWPASRVARELGIPEAAVTAWVRDLPAALLVSEEAGGLS
jgi:RNA polymerase sigma factor (sigma-70 family)